MQPAYDDDDDDDEAGYEPMDVSQTPLGPEPPGTDAKSSVLVIVEEEDDAAAAAESPPRQRRQPRRRLDFAPQPAQPAFQPVQELEPASAHRLEGAIAAINAKWPGVPVVAIYGKAPGLELPEFFWRSSVPLKEQLKGFLVAPLGEHAQSVRLRHTTLNPEKGQSASAMLRMYWGFHEGPLSDTSHGHFIIDVNAHTTLVDEWMILVGSRKVEHPVAVVLVQDNVTELRAIRLGFADFKATSTTPTEIKQSVANHYGYARGGDNLDARVVEIVLEEGFRREVWVGPDNVVHWRMLRHPLSRLQVDTSEHKRRGPPGLLERLSRLDASVFWDTQPPRTEMADDAVDLVKKTFSNGSVLYASVEEAPQLTAALQSLVSK